MRIRSTGLFLISLVFASSGLVLPGNSAAESGQSPGWEVTRVKQKGWNDRPDRGLIMYTSGVVESGAAFRCYLGEMTALLFDRPTDVLKQALDWRRQRTGTAVGYRINEGEEITANWNRSQGSKIYEARGPSSIRDVFLAATGGATITVSPKYGDTIVFTLHKADPELVKAFIEACELKEHLYR